MEAKQLTETLKINKNLLNITCEDMKLTILRSRNAAGRVNFLAKRKHVDGLPLLVHHSLRYSVS